MKTLAVKWQDVLGAVLWTTVRVRDDILPDDILDMMALLDSASYAAVQSVYVCTREPGMGIPPENGDYQSISDRLIERFGRSAFVLPAPKIVMMEDDRERACNVNGEPSRALITWCQQNQVTQAGDAVAAWSNGYRVKS
jgi:hypothetical protein